MYSTEKNGKHFVIPRYGQYNIKGTYISVHIAFTGYILFRFGRSLDIHLVHFFSNMYYMYYSEHVSGFFIALALDII